MWPSGDPLFDMPYLDHKIERVNYKQRNTVGQAWTVAVAERYGNPATGVYRNGNFTL